MRTVDREPYHDGIGYRVFARYANALCVHKRHGVSSRARILALLGSPLEACWGVHSAMQAPICCARGFLYNSKLLPIRNLNDLC